MEIKGEDKEILDAYERGDFKSVSNLKKEMVRYREYAKPTLRKNIENQYQAIGRGYLILNFFLASSSVIK